MIKKLKTKFNGLVVYEGKIYSDNRGNLREAFNKRDIPKNLCLSIVSKSKKNVLRGLHLQIKKPQDKIISVLKGKILDVVVDLRKNSKTFGQHFKIILSEKKAKYLFIPRGFAHGFLGLEKENIVLYSCSNLRNIKGERSIKWNDDILKIKWGIKKPVISKRDKSALSLKEFLNKN
jgi:dTDP-4-dehydrorhamnose 3,5-epimerase